MIGSERTDYIDVRGPLRCLRLTDPSNPGGSVGGSDAGIR